MSKLLVLAMIGAVGLTAGCERLGLARKATPDVVLPYRAGLKAERDGMLLVSVKAPGAPVEAVRESVRFPVTRHCLTQRGSSDADWVIDPATGDWAATTDGQGNLTFRARCRA